MMKLIQNPSECAHLRSRSLCDNGNNSVNSYGHRCLPMCPWMSKNTGRPSGLCPIFKKKGG